MCPIHIFSFIITADSKQLYLSEEPGATGVCVDPSKCGHPIANEKEIKMKSSPLTSLGSDLHI